MLSTLFAGPYWQRDTPVTLARYYPVPGTFKPVVESFGPGPFRHPSDLLVFAQHSCLDRGDLDEPLVCCSEDEGCLASPAMWVRVLDCLLLPERVLGLEAFDDQSVRISNRESRILSCFLSEAAGWVYGREGWQSISCADLEVLFSMTWSCVDGSGSFRHRNVFSAE